MVFNNKMIYLFFNVRSERWECIVGMTVRGSCHLVLTAAFHKQPMQHTHTHTVVLCGLADVPSEQAVLHCSNEEGGNESGDRSDTEK